MSAALHRGLRRLLSAPPFIAPLTGAGALTGATVGLSGARGVLGSLLAERLRALDIAVAAYPGDVRDSAELARWFSARQVTHFFHLAARVAVSAVERDPLGAFEINVLGSFQVCNALLRAQPQCWFFLASSSHVYRPHSDRTPLAEDAPTEPPTFYGVTKLEAEHVVAALCRKLQHPCCIGRLFSYTHERQAEPYLVPTLRRRIAELRDGAELSLENAEAVRDLSMAESHVDAMLQLATRRATGCLNIGSGQGHSVRAIAAAVAVDAGRTITIADSTGDAVSTLIADVSALRAALSVPAGAPLA